jgi:hypothetical protein
MVAYTHAAKEKGHIKSLEVMSTMSKMPQLMPSGVLNVGKLI